MLAETYLKCIILVTNFQKSPNAGGSLPPTPLKPSILVTRSSVIWSNCVFSSYNEIELQKIATTSFQWRHHHYVTETASQFFSSLGPLQSKFLAMPVALSLTLMSELV